MGYLLSCNSSHISIFTSEALSLSPTTITYFTTCFFLQNFFCCILNDFLPQASWICNVFMENLLLSCLPLSFCLNWPHTLFSWIANIAKGKHLLTLLTFLFCLFFFMYSYWLIVHSDKNMLNLIYVCNLFDNKTLSLILQGYFTHGF